ncbi:MAG: magnesium transporter MgtC [Nitrospira bacterium HGW-Nitrospira-1]|nr:MAG: magnesium transporter MgtC [Nitrospira bacterium HGW-Nitrospira-1]
MLTVNEILLRLLVGAMLGGIIGFERQTHGRPAGFRTQLLVCVACVLLMIISENYYAYGTITGIYTKLDPTRIAAGAMTGIGFLGAGVILKTGVSVQGLTTAACIWIVAAIGLAVGTGQYIAAITASVITFISLWMLRIVETKIPSLIYRYITLVTDESGDEHAIRSLFEERGFKVVKMDYEIAFPEKKKSFIFTIASKDLVPMKELIERVSSLNYIKRLEIKS